MLEEFKAVSLKADFGFPLKLHKRDEVELGYLESVDKNQNSANK